MSRRCRLCAHCTAWWRSTKRLGVRLPLQRCHRHFLVDMRLLSTSNDFQHTTLRAEDGIDLYVIETHSSSLLGLNPTIISRVTPSGLERIVTLDRRVFGPDLMLLPD